MKNEQELYLTKSEVENLCTLISKIDHIKNQVKGTIHPNIYKEINEVKKTLYQSLNKYFITNQAQQENSFEQLRNVQFANEFITSFAIPNVKVTDLSNDFSNGKKETIKKIEYIASDKMAYITNLENPENFTWMDVWKACDDLILKSGQTEDVLISDFIADKNEDGKYIVVTSH